MLASTVLETMGDLRRDQDVALRGGEQRKAQAIGLAIYKLKVLGCYVHKSRRTLNDLRMLRRLILNERLSVESLIGTLLADRLRHWPCLPFGRRRRSVLPNYGEKSWIRSRKPLTGPSAERPVPLPSPARPGAVRLYCRAPAEAPAGGAARPALRPALAAPGARAAVLAGAVAPSPLPLRRHAAHPDFAGFVILVSRAFTLLALGILDRFAGAPGGWYAAFHAYASTAVLLAMAAAMARPAHWETGPLPALRRCDLPAGPDRPPDGRGRSVRGQRGGLPPPPRRASLPALAGRIVVRARGVSRLARSSPGRLLRP